MNTPPLFNYGDLKADFKRDTNLDAKGNEALYFQYLQTIYSYNRNVLLAEIHNRIAQLKSIYEAKR